MPEGFEMAVQLLPESLCAAARAMPGYVKNSAEEFRLRTGTQPTLRLPEGERVFGSVRVTPETLRAVLERATNASMHAVADELRCGYISAPGGVRVGVCGTAVRENGMRALRDICSLCIRIPRQLRGIGRSAIERVKDDSVLIVSPPGGGKTTFLRELIRTVSDSGVRVCLADERGEIAGIYGGTAQFDIGRCTDVLTGVPKAQAATMLLRAMGPEVVAMDEIGTDEDADAVESLLGCGVRIFATAHASADGAPLARPVFRRLTETGAFGKIVRIGGAGVRSYVVETL